MKTILQICFVSFMIWGCQGRPSEEPPIHPNPNMDIQPKYKAQSEGKFFENGSAMRHPPAGTVALGQLKDEGAYYTGLDEKGQWVQTAPIVWTMEDLKRGQERYNIFCAPCHALAGRGNGIVAKRGFMPPPSLHLSLVRNYPDGHFYNVITNGIRNMPAYGAQIDVDDRWAIVGYIRALQRSQNASLEDVPTEIRKDLK